MKKEFFYDAPRLKEIEVRVLGQILAGSNIESGDIPGLTDDTADWDQPSE